MPLSNKVREHWMNNKKNFISLAIRALSEVFKA